jgi:hypothetical protein
MKNINERIRQIAAQEQGFVRETETEIQVHFDGCNREGGEDFIARLTREFPEVAFSVNGPGNTLRFGFSK